MITMKVTVNNKTGLHARPASKFAKTAARYQSKIMVQYNDRMFDAKSILSLLSAGVAPQSELILSAEGVDEETALKELVALVENGIGE